MKFLLLILFLSTSTIATPVYFVHYGCSLADSENESNRDRNIYEVLLNLESEKPEIDFDKHPHVELAFVNLKKNYSIDMTGMLMTRYTRPPYTESGETLNYTQFIINVVLKDNNGSDNKKVIEVSDRISLDLQLNKPSHDQEHLYLNQREYIRVIKIEKSIEFKGDNHILKCQVLVHESM